MSKSRLISPHDHGYVLLASLEGDLHFVFADRAFQSQHDLLRRLCLLVEHRLGLTTVTGLLSVVSSLSLSEQRSLPGLVLGDLVGTRETGPRW